VTVLSAQGGRNPRLAVDLRQSAFPGERVETPKDWNNSEAHRSNIRVAERTTKPLHKW
jgi:hypothetical protein